jgi:hypothetical protein
MMQNGKLYQQEMLEVNILEKDCGLSHTRENYSTPLSRDFRDNYTALRGRVGTKFEENGLPKTLYKEEVLTYLTPLSRDYKDTGGTVAYESRTLPRNLYKEEVLSYPTPLTRDYQDNYTTLRCRIGTRWEEDGLPKKLYKQEVLSYPTPRAADAEGGAVKNVEMSKKGSFSRKNKKGVRYGVKLKDAIMYLHKQLPKEEQNKILKNKISEMESLESKPLKYLKMNPNWIEWLMGYPKKWTDITTELKDLEMQSYHKSHTSSEKEL